jgi:arabinan endo-1,5-alpha-L-arabinosidase
MKSLILSAAITGMASLCLSRPALALDGEPFMHDPSTIMQCDGKYYTYGTGGGSLVSDDGWTWHSGGQRLAGGRVLAPDAIKIGDRYYISYAAGGGGMSGGHAGSIHVAWSKSLDPKSPDYPLNDDTVVATSDGVEDCDAIDPAFLLDPNDGRLWLSYGTFFGFIRLVELDPKTGHRLAGNQPLNIAIDCEATALLYRDGWYYLLGDHGTCCNGATSTYNIRVGRSKKVTGPYLDNMGQDMLKGGGKLVVAAGGRFIGPGHFGLLDLGDGVQKFSCHYESDLDRPGNFGVLDIRPLLWKDGWPVAGDNFKEGTFEIESVRSGYALELGVEYVPLSGGGRGGMPGGRGAGGGAGTRGPVPPQDVAQVSKNWPTGNVEIRLGDYMTLAHQKWTVSLVANAGGYPGSPYFKITIAGTDRALAATADGEVAAVPAFSGKPEELWRIDQLTDGTYRVMPKSVPNSKEPWVLTAVGASTPTLAKFDPKSDKARWNFKTP